MSKFAILLILFVAVLAMPTASASEYYLLPDNSNVANPGDCTTVSVWLDATDGVLAGLFTILYDSNCANITSFTYNNTCFVDPPTTVIVPGRLTCGYANMPGGMPTISPCTPGLVHLGDFEICCNTTTPPCQTDLVFYVGSLTHSTGVWDMGGEVPFTVNNGTFTCGSTPSEETFSKPLYEGWNLISLPLTPTDNSASAVLATVSYDVVYRYNATSKQFEGIGSTDAMNPGTGYFVHAIADCTWEYSGTAYNSMDISLKQGLNMLGGLNCTKDVDDALSSIHGDCYYVARWNTMSEKFDVYNPAAPAAFNDFTAMDQGTGYFISAKQDCTLSESC